jgi:hypothetical protein
VGVREYGDKEDLGTYGRITLKLILKKYVGRVQTGLIWLRTGTSGGLLLNLMNIRVP